MGSNEQPSPSPRETTVAFSGFNPEQSATLKLRLDMKRFQQTGEAVYLDESGREIKFLAASDPWERSAAPVSVPADVTQLIDGMLGAYSLAARTHDPAHIREYDAKRVALQTRIARQQSALDDLATAVKKGDPRRGGGFVVWPEKQWADVWSALTALLSTRETTTNG